MKKRIISKMFAITMATTMMLGSTLIVHAENWDDGVDHDAGGVSADYDDGSCVIESPSSSESGSSSSSDSGSSYSEPSYDSGSSNSGSSNSSSSDSGSSSSSSSSSSSASSSAPAPKAAGSTTSVTGKETFRALAKAGAGTYKVTHKGVEIATFTLMDADKKAVPCTAVALKQRSDAKWAIDFQVTVKNAETTEMADTANLTIGAPLDRTYMYSTLGVSYVTINDEIMINIEAEAAAKTTK